MLQMPKKKFIQDADHVPNSAIVFVFTWKLPEAWFCPDITNDLASPRG